jgi:hypothetical protein
MRHLKFEVVKQALAQLPVKNAIHFTFR